MSLSVGLLFALLVLAPGFALHAALFPFRGPTGIGSAPPQPGSVTSLSIVGFGALLVHAAWAIVSAVNEAVCASTRCLVVGFQPNIYTTLFAASDHRDSWRSGDGAWLLAATLLLTVSTYLIASALFRWRPFRLGLRGLQYGWLSDLVDLAESEHRFTTAFVISTAQHDGVALGYEGLLESLSVDADKAITSITLVDVSRFTLKVDEGRRSDIPGKPIPRLYLHKSGIQNVAFNVFEYEE